LTVYDVISYKDVIGVRRKGTFHRHIDCEKIKSNTLILITYWSTFVGKLWTAPEILRENNPSRRGTQRGDVYSYAIICYEIMMRTEPYNFDKITPRGKVKVCTKRQKWTKPNWDLCSV